MANPLDSFLGGMESIIGGIEKSKEFSDPIESEDIEDAEYTHNLDINFTKVNKPDLLWGLDKEAYIFHIFEGFQRSSLCNRTFDITQLDNRRTEMDDGSYKCCGGCLRSLHNKYKNS